MITTDTSRRPTDNRISLLETNSARTEILVDRIDKNVHSLTEITNKMSNIVAERGAILQAQGKDISELKEMMQRHMDASYREKEDTRKLISEIRVSTHRDIDAAIKTINEKVEETLKTVSEDVENIKNKINKMEKMYWVFSGVFAVLVFFVDQIKIANLFG